MRPATGPAPQPARTAPPEAPEALAPRCLVIEPERAMRDRIARSVGAAGAAVAAVGSLLSARAATAHTRPILVLAGPGVDDEVFAHLQLGTGPDDPARDVVRLVDGQDIPGDDRCYRLDDLPVVARAWASAHRALAPAAGAARVLAEALLAAPEPVLVVESPPAAPAFVRAANPAAQRLLGVQDGASLAPGAPATRTPATVALALACRQAVDDQRAGRLDVTVRGRVLSCRILPHGHSAGVTAVDVTDARRDAGRRAALARITDQVAHQVALQALCRTVCDELAERLGAARAAIGRLDGPRVTVMAVNGSATMTAPGPREAQASALSAAARTGRPSRAVFGPGGRVGWDARSRVEEAAVPISVDGEVWGALMAATDGEHGVAADAEAFMESLAHLLALAVGHDTRRQELLQHARSDGLTGLPNRRAFAERLAQETARARRHGRTLALAVIDIDRFKAVNDTHGHGVGDDVLRQTGARLAQMARVGDMVARLGGEEFVWLLPDTDAAAAVVAVERARVAVADAPFPVVGTVTVSIGVCDSGDAPDDDALLRCADSALYAAKHGGRNRTARHRSPRGVATPVERAERRADMCARVARALGWGEDRARELHRAVARLEGGGEPGDAHMIWGALTGAAWDTGRQPRIDPAAVLAAVRVWDAPSASSDAERFLRLHVAHRGLRPDVVASVAAQEHAWGYSASAGQNSGSI